jgi:uncharacterized protein (DUF58 family)
VILLPDTRDSGRRRRGQPVWRTTTTGVAGAGAGVILLALGLLAGRADVALFGVPLVVGAVWSGRPGAPTAARPAAPTRATLESSSEPAVAGELAATLDVDPPPAAELVQVRVRAPGHRQLELVVPAARRRLPLRLQAVRTGPQATFSTDLRGYGPGGTTAEDPLSSTAPDRLVLPGSMPLGRVPLPRRLRGLTGPHTSRRLGDGDELRDVHPFTAGDRVRRIDWRTTARRSPDLDTLYVRRTYATAEATAVLVLDSRDDVGPDLNTWRGSGAQRVDEATSLDLARHAAASVATALVGTGDRVGVDDLSRRRLPVPPAAGRRHLRRLLYALALSHPVGTPRRRLRPPQLPADAIVYLFTTALDDESLTLVRYWRDTGHGVVVVDTLPDIRPAHTEHLRIAWRITRMEREDRLHHMRAEGVPVIHWSDSQRHRAPARFDALVRAAERHRAPTSARTSPSTARP